MIQGDLVAWLEVKTNLEPEEVLVQTKAGEIYKTLLSQLNKNCIIKMTNDRLLIPLSLSYSYKEGILLTEQLLANSSYVRIILRLSDHSKYKLQITGKCLDSGICFSHKGDIIVNNYTKPLLQLSFEKAICNINSTTLLCRTAIRVVNGYIILHFDFNEYGRKTSAWFPTPIPVYVKEYVKENESLKYVSVLEANVYPPLPRQAIDLWVEPEHTYKGTLLPPGEYNLTLASSYTMAVYRLINEGKEIYIGTPWGVTPIEIYSWKS